ncbi:hypothetical protein BGX26_008505 [Mortierella sp. AD094]|nr:hypothetical protein BGX26_008505 [Mortierella sp. AD094]
MLGVVGESVDGEEEEAEAGVEEEDEDVDNSGDNGGDKSNKGREDEKDEEKENESDNGEERSVSEGGSLVGDKEDEDCDGDGDFVAEIEGEAVGIKGEAGIVVEIGRAIALLASLEAGWD